MGHLTDVIIAIPDAATHRGERAELQSLNSSIEVHDAVINESWDWDARMQKSRAMWRRQEQRNAAHISDIARNETLFGRLWRYWNVRE